MQNGDPAPIRRRLASRRDQAVVCESCGAKVERRMRGQRQIPIHATLIGSNCCQALGTTVRGSAPVLDLCRALVKAGHDPRRPLDSYHGDVLALKVRSIGEGARLTVREDRAGPRFVAWEPFPRRVGASVREKVEGIGSAPDQSDEPSASPGAAVRVSAKSLPDSETDSWGKGPVAE